MRLLLVEDDPSLAHGLLEALAGERFQCDHVATAEAARAASRLTPYDLAIVDLGLPDMDGLVLVKRLRERGEALPILILTARDGLQDRVEGLDQGADDYLAKPYLLPELLARIRALLRRSQARPQPVVGLGGLELDQTTREARLDGQPLELTGREWSVLERLLLASPKVVAKDKLTESLSCWDREITGNAVEIYVSRLRAKLQGSRVGIRTVRGIGYRIEEVSADADA